MTIYSLHRQSLVISREISRKIPTFLFTAMIFTFFFTKMFFIQFIVSKYEALEITNACT